MNSYSTQKSTVILREFQRPKDLIETTEPRCSRQILRKLTLTACPPRDSPLTQPHARHETSGMPTTPRIVAAVLLASIISCTPAPAQQPAAADAAAKPVLKGKDAMGDWSTDAPGVRRHLTAADMPAPNATKSVDNGPKKVARPKDAMPKVPPGVSVELLVAGRAAPR